MEDGTLTIVAADFGFTDPLDSPANNFSRVKVTTLSGAGTLKLNGTAVTAGDFVTVTDLNANKLTFEPVANANGSPYTTFTFQVEDDGGGTNLDLSANVITVNVTSVNDQSVVTSTGGTYTINAGQNLDLTASATDVDIVTNSQTLTFQWDFSYDGSTFNNEFNGGSVGYGGSTGSLTATVPWASTTGLNGLTPGVTYDVAVRAVDNLTLASTIVTTTLTINNAFVYTPVSDLVADSYKIVKNGNNVEIRSVPGDGLLSSAVLGGIGSIVITGGTDADTLLVDFSMGNPIPGGGIQFDGGAPTSVPGDKLVVTGGPGFTNVTYDMTGHGAGKLNLDGSLITFTGLEPVEVVPSLGTVTINIDPLNTATGTNTVELLDDVGSMMKVTASAPARCVRKHELRDADRGLDHQRR